MRRFEWDPAKARENLRKHGISFKAATLAFDDPYCVTDPDCILDDEQRWLTTGMTGSLVVVVVAHAIREYELEEVIRIISARKANRKERREYAEARS